MAVGSACTDEERSNNQAEAGEDSVHTGMAVARAGTVAVQTGWGTDQGLEVVERRYREHVAGNP